MWNMLAGIVNAGEAVILSMVVTRTDGLEDAGVLSIAFATGNLLMTVGKFGVRNYQSTDIEETFSFSDYFWARVFTVAVMILASLGYLAACIRWKGYSSSKASVIFAVCVIYAVESVEDVFWGMYQQKQALDCGAKMFVFRWVLILGMMIFWLLTGKGLKKAALTGAAAGGIAFLISQAAAGRRFHIKAGIPQPARIYRMLRQCFPLFAVAFLTFYVTNAPKYAIDRYLSGDVQACYGFLAMPVFVIGMLNGFLYQPSLVQMAVEWRGLQLQTFRTRVRRQCVILAVLSACCLTGAYVCGIPVLSFLYGTDLSDYQSELCILILGGGLLAYAGYFGVLLTIMRRQLMILYGYAGIAVLSFCGSGVMVRRFHVTGAAAFFALLMAVPAVFFSFVYLREVKRKELCGATLHRCELKQNI